MSPALQRGGHPIRSRREDATDAVTLAVLGDEPDLAIIVHRPPRDSDEETHP